MVLTKEKNICIEIKRVMQSKAIFFSKALPDVNAGATQVIGLQSGMSVGPRDQLLLNSHVNSIVLV